MADPRTAREIAEAIILSHTEDIEWGSINEMTEDEFDALGEDAHEALCHEVDDLISKAVVTVTWPETEAATTPDDVQVVTVTVRDLDGWDLREHIKHLMEAEGYDADVTHG